MHKKKKKPESVPIYKKIDKITWVFLIVILTSSVIMAYFLWPDTIEQKANPVTLDDYVQYEVTRYMLENNRFDVKLLELNDYEATKEFYAIKTDHEMVMQTRYSTLDDDICKTIDHISDTQITGIRLCDFTMFENGIKLFLIPAKDWVYYYDDFVNNFCEDGLCKYGNAVFRL